MAKVVSFPEGKVLDAGSHPDLVKLCTRLLKDAKAGKLQAIAIASVYDDGELYSDWSAGDDWLELMASVSKLKRRMEEEDDG